MDAQRNLDALLQAANAAFARSGVDVPVREIVDGAGVGIGTLYRHFPQRSDLIAAVFRRDMDACADAAPELSADHPPFEALVHWMHRYATFVATKRGLATALYSGNPAFDGLQAHFEARLRPAFRSLYDAAAAAGDIRTDILADDVMTAVANLCMSADGGPGHAARMVDLLVDGLRHGMRDRATEARS